MRFLLFSLLLILPAVLALPTNKPKSTIENSMLSKISSYFHSDPAAAIITIQEESEGQDATTEDLSQEEEEYYKAKSKGATKVSSKYPVCESMMRSGFASYTGWKLIGDDMSGALPVSPRSHCLNLCHAYGNSCGGVYFDDDAYRCWLKGIKYEKWEFVETGNESDVLSLVGGCAAWGELVPEEMDEVCCRD
ncbi:uncharacterized protein I206_107287 [Kwoniella pini CBS 10737]|uniref:Apple domain-containing protein n=1 Tax=Kwoniella pini CBS 10737 TaxID=1296096 RepID=A0A1B9HYS1_9TREE|nr:uncharacterized protein I206_05168 [Kwoniella pini CBS 10737]OCF48391.1 hypothetical protein I206_05168 [Kwoniella pini CBS 10737]